MTLAIRYIFFTVASLTTAASFAQLTLKKVLVNGQVFPITSTQNIQLSAAEDDLLLEFQAIKSDSGEYLYNLTAAKEEIQWITSSYPTAHFQKLDGGTIFFR